MTDIGRAYFNKGRCSGHEQFNGRYCRDVAGPDRWCIHCCGFMLQQQLAEAQRSIIAPTTLTAAAHMLRACADYIESLSIGYGAEQMKAIAGELDTGSAEMLKHWLAADAARYEAQRSAAALRAALQLLSDRHDWMPGCGQCVCLPHETARKLLAHGPDATPTTL